MTNNKHKFPKPVAFNINNPTDKAILDFVKKRNFSGYVKQLIVADMKAKGIDVPKRQRTQRVTAAEPTQNSRLEQLKRKLAEKRSNGNSDDSSNT